MTTVRNYERLMIVHVRVQRHIFLRGLQAATVIRPGMCT